MSKGFIFNQNLCVACNACVAACSLENGWTIQARRLLVFNSDISPSLPVINLSSACNHCETALCLEGCPVNAFTREPASGAIVIDDEICIGCNYCLWNCPYGAPVADTEKRTIGKCNLCYSNLRDGYMPACTSACPTGALKYGELPERNNENIPLWFPDKDLNPAIAFTAKADKVPLKIIPGTNYYADPVITGKKENKNSVAWSLVSFSFLATVSTALIISSFLNDNPYEKWISVLLIIIAGLSSLFHLGRKERAWRAMTNLKTSPLSREIFMFLLYSLLSFATMLFNLPVLIIASALAGLMLLILIDSVYIFADRRLSVVVHSGQTFISALLIVSFLSENILPFVFIASIKIISSAFLLLNDERIYNLVNIRIMRIALLAITGVSLVTKISITDPVIILLFLAGELIDRVLFYIDYKPVSIDGMIGKQSNIFKNEEKRD
jgi:Fe-S-cluster-containing dehydrogenase component/DMSO reductase anchor subunit